MYYRAKFLVVFSCAILVMGGLALYQFSFPAQAQDSGYDYVPLPDGILQDKATIDGWIAAGDIGSVRAHAWNLWAGMTQDSGQTFSGVALPVWDTWYSGHDIYDIGPMAAQNGGHRGTPHDLEEPRQLGGLHAPADESEAVLGFNKFTWEAAEHIWSNGYWLTTTLDNLLHDCNPGAPPPACAIQPFPSSAIALKPTLMLVASDAVTVIPVWKGVVPGETTTWEIGDSSTAPGSDSWKQCVAIDPSGAHQPGDIIDVTCNQMQMQAEVVALDDFYHFPLTEAEVTQLSDSEQPFASKAQLADGSTHDVALGDSLILVGMHMTTREVDLWTWQTFWWSPEPDDATPAIFPPNAASTEDVIQNGDMYVNYPGSGVDRPADLPAPWNHYVMCTNYQYVNPVQPAVGGTNDGTLPNLCFNPYLEASFTPAVTPPGYFQPGGGINTNCMTCHGNATWQGYVNNQAVTLPYTAAEYVSRDDSRFDGYLQLDFSWNVTRAHLSEPPSPNATPETTAEATANS